MPTSLHFDLAWVTTPDLLDRYAQARRGTSFLSRLFYGYDVPPGLPALRVGRRRYPLLFLAEGPLTLTPAGLTFNAPANARLRRTAYLEYENLRQDLTFTIPLAALLSVEPFTPQGAPIPDTPPYLHLRTTLPDLAGNFLLCAADRDPSLRPNPAQTASLSEALHSLLPPSSSSLNSKL